MYPDLPVPDLLDCLISGNWTLCSKYIGTLKDQDIYLYIQYICTYQSFYFEKTSIKRKKLLKYTPLTEIEPIQHAALKNDLPLRGQRI